MVFRMLKSLFSSPPSPPPEYELRRVEDVSVLTLRGDFGDDADKVIDSAFALLKKDQPVRVVVDVADARFLGNRTVGKLIMYLIELRKAETPLRLVADLRGHSEWWLVVTKLNQVFQTYEDEAQAIASFRKDED